MASLTLPHALCGRGAPRLRFADRGQFQTAVCPGSYSRHVVDPGSGHEQSKSVNSILDYFVLSLMLGKKKLA